MKDQTSFPTLLEGEELDEMDNQSANCFETDLNPNALDEDEYVSEVIMKGKRAHRNTMQNKVFIQNHYGFIGEHMAIEEAKNKESKVRLPKY